MVAVIVIIPAILLDTILLKVNVMPSAAVGKVTPKSVAVRELIEDGRTFDFDVLKVDERDILAFIIDCEASVLHPVNSNVFVAICVESIVYVATTVIVPVSG